MYLKAENKMRDHFSNSEMVIFFYLSELLNNRTKVFEEFMKSWKEAYSVQTRVRRKLKGATSKRDVPLNDTSIEMNAVFKPFLLGRGRRTRTLGTRFWSDC